MLKKRWFFTVADDSDCDPSEQEALEWPKFFIYQVECVCNIQLPDDLAQRLTAAGGDLSRRALEALAIEEYKIGHLTSAELRRLLGLRTRISLDEFLKNHRVLLDYTLSDLEQEWHDLRRLGF